MRIIKLAFILVMLALATNAQTPLTPQFPTGVPNQTSMGNIGDNGRSLLTATIDASTISIPIAADNFTVVPFIIAIDQEKLLCTGKSGLVLTCSRGYDGSTATAHLNRSVIINSIASKYFKIMQLEIAAFAAKIGTGASTPVIGSLFVSNTNGQSTWLTGADNTCLQKQGGVIVLATCAGGGSSFNQTIKSGGSSVTQRPSFNFSSTFSITDNSGSTRTDIDIANAGIDLTSKVTGLLPDGNIASASAWNAKQPAGNYVSSGQARATVVGTTAATMSNPRDVAVVGKIAFVTNFGANAINLYDVSNPASPTLISTITDADLIAPRQTAIQGKYLYVSNQNGNSYTVFDISNPKSPSKLVTKSGGAIASPGGIYVRGKYLYLTGTQTGSQLTIFDNTNPALPIELGSYTAPSGEKFGRCSFQSKYAYCPLQSGGPFTDDGLYVIDISNPASPSQVGRFLVNGIGTTGAPVDSSIIGQTVYELDEGGGMRIIDVTDPTSPTQLGYTTAGIAGGSTGIHAQGHYAYVSSQINNTVVAFDVSDPTNPTVAATSAATLNVPSKLTVVGRYLYVVNRSGNSMSIVDLGQDDVAQIKAGAVQADYISSTNGLRAGYSTIDGDLFVGRTAQIGDNLSINGSVKVKNDVTAATFNGSALGSAAFANTNAFEVPLSFGSGLTRSTNMITVNSTQSISKLSNLTSNGFVKTSGGDGTLSIDANTYENPLTFGAGLTRSTNAVSVSLIDVAHGGTGQTSYTDGQLMIGNTATGLMSKATLTQGTGITITNGNGTITIASTGGASFANPTATVGTSAVNGSASTAMRSDAAPAIDQTMSPVMSGVWNFTPTARSSGVVPYFKVTVPGDTGLTASTEAIGESHVTGTRQWATGNISGDQRERVYAGPTYAFVGASSIGRAINGYFSSPIQGTNATLTKSIALTLEASAAADVPLYIRGASSQSGNLQEWVNSSNTVLASITSVGNFSAVNGTFSGTLSVTGHTTFEGVTSTGATGSGRLMYNNNPSIATGIRDNNGPQIFNFTATGSAVDSFTFANGAAGSPGVITMSATGTDTNINIAVTPKGSGVVSVGTSVNVPSAGFYTFNSDTGLNRVAAKVVAASSGGASIDGWLVDAGTSRVSTQFDKTTDTTLANIPGLTATVIAGRTYTFKAVLFVTYDATGVGKVSIAGTATATAISYDGYGSRTAAAGTLSLGYTSALGTSVPVVTPTIKTIIIEGTITVNAGGTLTVQFAQNASSGTSSVLVGSSFTVRDMGS